MKALVFIALLACVSVGASAFSETGSDVETAWADLHACLKLNSAQIAKLHTHLRQMEDHAAGLAENPGVLPADSLSREMRKQSRDLRQLYAEQDLRYARTMNAMERFRDAVDAEMPFDESKVGRCPEGRGV